MILGIGGNIPRAAVEAAVESATRGWQRGRAATPLPRSIDPRPPERYFHAVDVPSVEGWIAIGKAVSAVPPEDRAALATLAFILGERLNIAAREIRGLTNRDRFFLPETGSGTGLVHIRTGGRPEAVAPLIRFSLDEVRRLHDPEEPVTGHEVTRAQGWLVHSAWRGRLEGAANSSASYAVEHVRHGGTAELLAWPEAVRSVTAADVKGAADRYLDPSSLVTVVVGPIARIRAARHPRWPVSLDEVEASLGGG